jgi:hypothetical protein
VGTEIRHQYAPWDFVKDESWKVTFPQTDPMITVTLDSGTFEWLWDFVARKGRQADAPNFHYSDIHRDVYQRAANQFANAAKEALGDTYKVKDQTPVKKATAKEPAEAIAEPPKRRKRRRPADAPAKTFEASESPVEPVKRKRRRKPRSEA